MTKVIFDTNIYNYASWGYSPAEDLINNHATSMASDILMPVIIQAELMSIPKIQKDKAYKVVIDKYIALSRDENRIIPINDEIIKLASNVRIEWHQRKGKKLSLPDALIGATAVVEGATLYCNNDKDFSFFVENYGLSYVNPINQTHLQQYIESKGFSNETDLSTKFISGIQELNVNSLRALCISIFSHLTKENKRAVIKQIDNL